MIVYNVKRRWFASKADAEAYRKAEGLKPAAAAGVRIESREQLAFLLNALCGAEPAGIAVAAAATGADVPKIVDRAFVDPHADVPLFVPAFLIKDEKQRAAHVERLRNTLETILSA